MIGLSGALLVVDYVFGAGPQKTRTARGRSFVFRGLVETMSLDVPRKGAEEKGLLSLGWLSSAPLMLSRRCQMKNSIRIVVVCAAILLTVSVSGLALATLITPSTQRTRLHPLYGGARQLRRCKDGFYSTKPITSPSGTTITSIRVVSRSPTTNNHWYRCQVEVNCGVEEFSDVSVHNKSCLGTSSCLVWRATDGFKRQRARCH